MFIVTYADTHFAFFALNTLPLKSKQNIIFQLHYIILFWPSFDRMSCKIIRKIAVSFTLNLFQTVDEVFRVSRLCYLRKQGKIDITSDRQFG